MPDDDDWLDWVAAPQSEAELKSIRAAVVRGSPYGAAAWQHRTARRLDLEATLRPVGRPKKKPAAAKGASEK